MSLMMSIRSDLSPTLDRKLIHWESFSAR